jgi:TRAP-type C4-dicarboxylate transport system permease small subunit
MINRLEQVLRVIGATALFTLFALIVLQVVLRYGFGFTPFFTEEIGRYALVWSVLVGTAVSVAINGHIRVTFVPDNMPPLYRWWWMRFLDLITLLLMAVLTFAGVQTVEFAQGQTSDGMQIPLMYPYTILPVAFGAAFLFIFIRISRSWRDRPWSQNGSAEG